MKKVLVGLLTIGLLTGCGGLSDEAKREEAFVRTMHEAYPGLEDYPRDKLIQGGKDICGFLDDGMSLDGIVATARDAGVPEDLMGAFAGAGIPAFCPERQPQLYEWIHG